MKIQNIINGRVVEDPAELERLLDLSMNDNLMINSKYPFTGKSAEADNPGVQLVVVMLSVRMSRLGSYNLIDFIQRLAFQDACGESPIPLKNGVDDLLGVFTKLRGWMWKGWEIETDLSHMDRPDFVEYTNFRIQQDVIKQIRATRKAVAEELMNRLPEEAAKEIEL